MSQARMQNTEPLLAGLPLFRLVSGTTCTRAPQRKALIDMGALPVCIYVWCCAALERLRISDCDDLTDAGLASLMPLTRLSWLHLSRLPNVVGFGFVHASSGLMRLRNLKFDAVRESASHSSIVPIFFCDVFGPTQHDDIRLHFSSDGTCCCGCACGVFCQQASKQV